MVFINIIFIDRHFRGGNMVKYNFDSDDMERKIIIRRLEKIKESLIRRNKIKDIISDEKAEPYVIELCGLPKTGKSLCIEKIKEFFSEQGITVKVLDDPVTDLTYKNIRNMPSLKFNDNMIEAIKKDLNDAKKQNPDIIIMENGLIDSYFFYQELYDNGQMSEKEFQKRIEMLDDDFKEVDQLYIMNASLNEVYKRDNKVVIDFLIERKQNVDKFFNTLAGVGEINTDSIDEVYTPLIVIDSITGGFLGKLNNNKKSSSEKFMSSFMGKLKNDEYKKNLPPVNEKLNLDESTVNSELEKYNKLLSSDNMKLVMKKD